MAKHLITLAFLLIMVSPVPKNPGQANIIFSQPEVAYEFGKQVTFSIQIESNEPLSRLYLLLEIPQDEQRIEIPVSTGEKQIRYVYDAAANPLRPFAVLRYRFQAVSFEGIESTSEVYSFLYEDNRFQWQMLERDGIRVHWQSQDEALGRTIHAIAARGLESARQNIPGVPNPELIHIYAYANISDLQFAIGKNQPEWIGGHTFVEDGVILVAVQPQNDTFPTLERDIPHELAHLLEYELLGDNIDKVPTLLLEGIATLSELNPNPEYQISLDQAKEDGALYPIPSLCNGFPQEGSAAFISYAQSYSFTRYLREKYGASGLKDLLITYGDGVGCEEGTNIVFGIPLVQLENEWKQEELGIIIQKQAFANLSPYLLLLAVFFLIIITPLIPFFFKNWARR